MKIIKQLLVATCALVMVATLGAMETPLTVVDETVKDLYHAIEKSQDDSVQEILSQNRGLQLPDDILFRLTSDSQENKQILISLLEHEKALSPNIPSHLINHVRPEDSSDRYAGMSIIHYFTQRNFLELVSTLVVQYQANPNLKVNYKDSIYFSKSPIVIATDNFLREATAHGLDASKASSTSDYFDRSHKMFIFLSKRVILDETDLQLIKVRYNLAKRENMAPIYHSTLHHYIPFLQPSFLQQFEAPQNNQNSHLGGTIATILTHRNSYFFGGVCLAAFLGYVIYKYYNKPKPKTSAHKKAKAAYEAVKPS